MSPFLLLLLLLLLLLPLLLLLLLLLLLPSLALPAGTTWSLRSRSATLLSVLLCAHSLWMGTLSAGTWHKMR